MIGWWRILQQELRVIVTDFSVAVTVFGGIILYSFLYPLPYSHQVPREQHVVVVNEDESQLSRTLERMVDATPEVTVIARVATLAEAEALVLAGEAGGILLIPRHFYRDLLLGRSPTLGYAGNASYFLIFSTVIEGMASAAGTLGAQIRVVHNLTSGSALPLAAAQYTPIKLNLVPVFNTPMGYVNYVVPAVFVLILQQTLLMAIGELTSHQNAHRTASSAYWQAASVWQLLSVRVTAFGAIYLIATMYYFGFCFDFYAISRQASFASLALVIVPFLLSGMALGIVIGQLIRRPEILSLLVLVSSLLFAFSAGFIWPLSSIPEPVIWLTSLVPSTPGIQAFLRINQMGAELNQILPQLGLLWLQVIIYGPLAFWLLQRSRACTIKDASEIRQS